MIHTGVVWLRVAHVRKCHALAMRLGGGAGTGVRSAVYLDSAVQAPRAGYCTSLAQLAAAYAWGLTNNHPFVDGNKRAALCAAFVFLDMNGVATARDTLDRPAWRRTLRGVAAGTVTRESLVRRFARAMGGDVQIQEAAMARKGKTQRDTLPVGYRMVVQEGKDGWWWGHCPELEGAFGQGRSAAAARCNLASAIKDVLVTYRLLRRRPPAPRGASR